MFFLHYSLLLAGYDRNIKHYLKLVANNGKYFAPQNCKMNVLFHSEAALSLPIMRPFANQIWAYGSFDRAHRMHRSAICTHFVFFWVSSER